MLFEGEIMIVKAINTNAIYDKNLHVSRKNHDDAYLYVQFLTETMVETDGVFIKVNPGNGILYGNNDILNYYGCDSEIFNHNYIVFKFENQAEEKYFDKIPRRKIINHPSPELISKSLSDIKDMYFTNSGHRNEIISDYVRILLYRLLDDYSIVQKGTFVHKYHKTFCDLRQEIYTAPSIDYDVLNVSKRLCIAKSYFQHLYKEFFGISFIGDVINARITLAMNLLENTDLTVGEISTKCGYNTLEHFIRQFSKNCRLTPGQYRKNNLNARQIHT